MIDLTSEFGRIVEHNLNKEYFIWLTTVGSDITPQPRPVWFIWDGNSVFIFSRAEAQKLKHLAKHPNVALHFNTLDELATQRIVVIIGRAAVEPGVPPVHEFPAYLEKYRDGIARLGSTPEDFSRAYSVAICVTPTSVRGW